MNTVLRKEHPLLKNRTFFAETAVPDQEIPLQGEQIIPGIVIVTLLEIVLVVDLPITSFEIVTNVTVSHKELVTSVRQPHTYLEIVTVQEVPPKGESHKETIERVLRGISMQVKGETYQSVSGPL